MRGARTFAAIVVTLAAALIPGVAQAASFTPAPGSPYGTPSAASLATADFTGDGVLDLAATGTSTTFVYSFLGNGAAGFSPALGSPFTILGFEPSGIAAGSFDADGDVDLMLGTADATTPDILFAAGNGSGAFFDAGTTGAQPTSNDVRAGDLDNDGNLDVVASSSTTFLSVLLNNGAANFAANTALLSATIERIALADFNGDGNLDIAALGSAGLEILLGDGAGAFTSLGLPTPAGLQANGLAVADFDGDGDPDVASTTRVTGQLTVLLNNGAGVMTALPSVFIDAAGLAGSVASDFNGDGHPDLVVASRTTNLHVLLGNGTGTFTAASDSPLTTASGVGNLVAGDFDGDGHPDLAGVSSTSMVVYRNAFVWPTPPTPPAPPAPAGVPLPVVDALSPAEGRTDGGEPIVISGQNFGSVQQVWFGDVAAASFRVERFDRVEAVAPAHAAGTVAVRVQTAAGTSAMTDRSHYRYVEAPRPQSPPDTPATSTPPQAKPTAASCVVPSLRGLRLSVARKRLERAGCALGNVRRLRGARGARAQRVIRQKLAAGRQEPAGRHVAVTVRPTRR
jgi:hypothetical protein